ncbi:GNAT family N-acetyltransferase [Marinobacterium arenosum]|uniref:GNAT family N-acetyltransferase n=1 Tax=Marinobacterium arenosum TaxID=2862496 RepID=UPI001C97F172|nr:GNAT family N-acetyltransferase [Marinobacterium arenosum]MBY4676055.1 GNAT family N-acetyltransferase [Marinobacterium arenosum]
MHIRTAYRTDAEALAHLIDIAREGIPSYLWRRLTEPDETALEVGAKRIEEDDSFFSYRRIRLAENGHRIIGLVASFHQPASRPQTWLDEFATAVRPLAELERETADSWYISALATDEEFRGQGVGTALLNCAEEVARQMRVARSTLIVADGNPEAFEFACRRGYQEEAWQRAVGFDGTLHGGRWVLMSKQL